MSITKNATNLLPGAGLDFAEAAHITTSNKNARVRGVSLLHDLVLVYVQCSIIRLERCRRSFVDPKRTMRGTQRSKIHRLENIITLQMGAHAAFTISHFGLSL